MNIFSKRIVISSITLLGMYSSAASAQLCTPTQVNALTSPRTGQLIQDEDILYAVGQVGLSVYFTGDPANPALIATLPLGGSGTGIGVRDGDTLYATNSNGTLHAIDISDPAHPVSVVQGATNPIIEDLLIVGEWIVQGNAIGQHQVIDPVTLAVVSSVPGIAGSTTLIPSDDGRLWAAAADEILIYDIDGAGQITLGDSIPALVDASYGLVDDGVLFVSDGLNGVDNTLSIVDVSNINAPVVISTETIGGGVRGEIIREGSQIIVSTNGPVTIVDASQLDDPFVVSRFTGIADTSAPNGSYLYTSTTSSSAVLRVFDRSGCPNLPVILQQPQSVLVEQAGDAAQFHVSALLDSTYQWYRNGEAITDGDAFSGATTPSLTVQASLMNLGLYRVIVTNPQGDSASNEVGLSIRNLCPADLNNDGVLNFFDVSVFLSLYQAGCP